jgi:hypothetical protein
MRLDTGLGIVAAVGAVAGMVAHTAMDTHVHGSRIGLRPRTANPDPRMWIPAGSAAAVTVGGTALAMVAATKWSGNGAMHAGVGIAAFGAAALLGTASAATMNAMFA